MAVKRYDVCIPRKYKTSDGAEKTHFWQCGTAFPLKERDGFSVRLWLRVLPTDELVLFVHEDRAPASGTAKPEADEVPDDDIPF